MYLVNIIAALLDETDLDTAERAEEIIQEIQVAMPADAPNMPDDIPDSLWVAQDKIKDFADHYLYGSEDAADVLAGILTLRAVGLSPGQLDGARAHVPTRPFGRVYGRQKPMRHRRISQALKRADWGRVDLESEKGKAALWVRARHVHQDLKLAIAEKMGDIPFNDRGEQILDGYTAVSEYNHWARELKPLDESVGRIRKPGRPKTSTRI